MRQANKYGVKNNLNDFGSLLTYDESGLVDYTDRFDDFEDAYAKIEEETGKVLDKNIKDKSFRAALRLAGWNPLGDAHRQAVEWFELDFEYAQTPDVSSERFAIENLVSTAGVLSRASANKKR